MKKLHELLGKDNVAGDVGIEIEVEGAGLREVNNVYWHSEDDASLRGRYPDSRCEYVLQQPIKLGSVVAAMKNINDILVDSKPVFSHRTSVHVHVNVLDLTEDQLFSFIYTYMLIEEALFNYCGNVRKCNRFCLRLQDADVIAITLSNIFKKGVEYLMALPQDTIRYSAMNLAAVAKYGSVEFRGMQGTLDSNTINTWTTALISVRNFACHQKDVLDVHDLYVRMGAEKFLEHVLGDLSSVFKYPKMVKDIQRSYSLSIDLPYAYKEYKERPVKEPAPKKNEIKGVKFDRIIVDDVAPFNRNVNVDFAQAVVPPPRIRKPAVKPAIQPAETLDIGDVVMNDHIHEYIHEDDEEQWVDVELIDHRRVKMSFAYILLSFLDEDGIEL